MSDREFPKHFEGRRFYNSDAPQARGFLHVLQWKLRSRPEPSPEFISDVELWLANCYSAHFSSGSQLNVTMLRWAENG